MLLQALSTIVRPVETTNTVEEVPTHNRLVTRCPTTSPLTRCSASFPARSVWIATKDQHMSLAKF